ncbi:hypothetical protein PG995_005358 [Apiospora arundinis]
MAHYIYFAISALVTLSPGDFAFVPPWTEHQEVNDTDEDVVWILIRNGPTPLVFYLTDWGGDEAKKSEEDTE